MCFNDGFKSYLNKKNEDITSGVMFILSIVSLIGRASYTVLTIFRSELLLLSRPGFDQSLSGRQPLHFCSRRVRGSLLFIADDNKSKCSIQSWCSVLTDHPYHASVLPLRVFLAWPFLHVRQLGTRDAQDAPTTKIPRSKEELNIGFYDINDGDETFFSVYEHLHEHGDENRNTFSSVLGLRNMPSEVVCIHAHLYM